MVKEIMKKCCGRVNGKSEGGMKTKQKGGTANETDEEEMCSETEMVTRHCFSLPLKPCRENDNRVTSQF